MLIVDLTLPNGARGTRVRLETIDWSHARRVTANLALYTSPAHAAAGRSLGVIAQLSLEGDKFDEYLSRASLEAVENGGPDPFRHQLYAAAKIEPLRIVVDGLFSCDLSDAASDD